MTQNQLFLDLNTGLPDDIQKFKDAGNLDSAISLIDRRLGEPGLTQSVKNSLILQKEMIKRTPLSFTVPFSEALERVREIVPDYTEDQLSEFLVNRTIDWCYIDGKICLLSNFLDTMKRYDSFNELIPGYVKEKLEDKERYKVVTRIKADGKSVSRVRIRQSIRLKDEFFKYDMKLKVHIPIPIPCSHQTDIRIEKVFPEGGVIAPETALQRAVSWDVELAQNTEFFVEYSYLSSYEYVDVYEEKKKGNKAGRLSNMSNEDFTKLLLEEFSDVKMVTDSHDFKKDLKEEAPHIVFTPFIRSLCKELSEGKITHFEKAKAFYDYITLNMSYGYQPEYFLMSNIPERCAKSLRGDCGVFALLFITLCRCAGIPAQWESGLCISGGEAHNHDWSKVYIEPYGWIYVDPSFGIGSRTMGFEEGRQYFFGNLDDQRMAANRAFEKPFDNEKQFFRIDPYDNQNGEIESDERGFTRNEIESKSELLYFVNEKDETPEQLEF